MNIYATHRFFFFLTMPIFVISILSKMSFSESSIIKSFNRELVIVVLKWFLINFSLLKHRSFEAVVTGYVNAKRQSSLAIGIIVLNLLATSITLANDLTFSVCSLNIFISHNALLKSVT